MPIYQYCAKDRRRGCNYCRDGFDIFAKISDRPLEKCPKCGGPVVKTFSVFSVGFSKSSFDSKAKEKGFHKLKKVDKGKYEKIY